MNNEYLDDIIMPFGQHKGEYVCDLELTYLEWLLAHCDLYGDLKSAVEKAIDDNYLKLK